MALTDDQATPAELQSEQESSLLEAWDNDAPRQDVAVTERTLPPAQKRAPARTAEPGSPTAPVRRVRPRAPLSGIAPAGDPASANGATHAPAAAPAPEPQVDDETTPSFEDLGLSGMLLKSIRDVGYEEPTPIQLMTIPVMLQGKDIIAQAQTGSGKTAAFGFPIIESIAPRDRHVQALILCPTRELAIQVAEALHKYGRHKEVETLPIYGGQPYERQFRGLQRGVQIVVGTPGRVMDHMRRGTLNLDHIRFFILDEADEMLDMGFIEDIEWILEHVPQERQTALFSATMPPRIVELARRYMREPERQTVPGKQMTVPETRQSYYEVPRQRKADALTRILDAETPPLAMIFCRTKLGVDELGEALLARGFPVETLHGDLSQAQRDRVMRRFRSGQADLLIATDVAARGLDIPDVSHVINYDVPESAEAYVHRIGRTGRAGKSGEAVTLVTPRETRWMHQIERIIKARIEPRRLPTAADVAERRRDAMKQQILDVLKDENTYTQYLATIEDLTEERDVAEVAAAILKLYADETGRGTTPDQKEDDLATFSAAAAGAGRGESGMVRLFLNVGRNLGVRPQDIVGAIANEANIPGKSIGAIDILDAYSFVDIPSDFVERVIEALHRSGIKGRSVNAEVAQPGAGPQGRERRDSGGFRGPRREDGVGGPPRFERDRDQARGFRGGDRDGGVRSGPGFSRRPDRDRFAGPRSPRGDDGGRPPVDRGPRGDR